MLSGIPFSELKVEAISGFKVEATLRSVPMQTVASHAVCGALVALGRHSPLTLLRMPSRTQAPPKKGPFLELLFVKPKGFQSAGPTPNTRTYPAISLSDRRHACSIYAHRGTAAEPWRPMFLVLVPKGSKYHCNAYIDPKVGIYGPLQGPDICHMDTWTLWGSPC